MNRKISICDIINISSIIQNKEKYKSRALLRDRCHCCSDFRALVRTIPDTSKSAPLFAFNHEKAELALTSRRCNVATLRRGDVEASRCCILLTFILVDPTSQRWDVTTWGRRDVGTSRRGDVATWGRRDVLAILMNCILLLQNCFQKMPFLHQLHLHTHQSPIRYPTTKTTKLNIK